MCKLKMHKNNIVMARVLKELQGTSVFYNLYELTNDRLTVKKCINRTMNMLLRIESLFKTILSPSFVKTFHSQTMIISVQTFCSLIKEIHGPLLKFYSPVFAVTVVGLMAHPNLVSAVGK